MFSFLKDPGQSTQQQSKQIISVNDIEKASLFTIYNYIRFDVFPKESTADLKRVFQKLFYVSLQTKEIMPVFVDALNKRSLQGLEIFADKHKFDVDSFMKKLQTYLETSSELKELNAKVDIVEKNPEAILDLYFAQTTKQTAENVLARFGTVSFETEEMMNAYIENFKKLSLEEQGKPLFA
jgi:hypothetical protein